MRTTPAEPMAEARASLEAKVDEWLQEREGQLTSAEFVKVVVGVLAEAVDLWARQEIDNDRSRSAGAPRLLR